MRHAAIIALACLLAVACGNPKDPAGWAERAASRTRLDEKLEALGQVRKAPGDKRAAVKYLVEVLRQAPRARGEAAVALGEIGDPAAVPALVAAIDAGARDRDTVDANRHVVDALGALRAKEAIPKLTELTTSPDGYTQVAAVDALGRIGDPGAVDTLVRIAKSQQTEPFTARKALLALGRIGDKRAGPAVLEMLFEERPGVSFFAEASFAATQIGAPMAGPLLAVLEGRDAALSAWARERGVVPGALFAKSAQLLGDVGDSQAVPALIAKLSYRDPDPGVQILVRVFAAESLGRIRAREAARPLAELAAREQDPNVRDRYCDALSRIGDPSAIRVLQPAAMTGSWDLREGPLTAVSRLGGKGERAIVDAAKAKDCGAKCEAAREAAYAGMAARLDASVACGSDVGCWAGKLGDRSAAVRDRAALEVGRTGGAKEAAALADAVVRPVADDADLAARYHAVLALGWISAREKLSAGGTIADRIDAMLAADRGRTLTAGANDDALRVATRLRRAAEGR
jgi:HEAT repeat protein